jgi:hypothetical protein
MRQMVPLLPIAWGGDTRPHSLIGSRDLVDTSMSLDARLTGVNGSLILGARLAGTTNSAGLVFSFNASGGWNLTAMMKAVMSGPALASGSLPSPLGVGAWHHFRLDVNGTRANLWLDGAPAIAALDVSSAGLTGHSGVGTVQFGHYTEFDNFELYSTQKGACHAAPPAGTPISAVSCASEVGPTPGGQLTFAPTNHSACPLGSPCSGGTGTFALAANPALCIAVAPGGAGEDWPLALAPCDAASPNQLFTQAYTMLYSSAIVHAASGRQVCLTSPDIGALAFAQAKGGAANSCGAFTFVGDEMEIVSINAFSVCLGAAAC